MVAAATVTAAIAFVGLRDIPAARSGDPGSTGVQAGSSAGSSGGADVAAPVEVSRSAGARASIVPYRDTAAAKSESLAVAATKHADSGASRRPAQSGGLVFPAVPSSAGAAPSPSPSASTGGSQPSGTLSVTPDPVSMGTQSTDQLTLAASGGPVSWSASTSTGRLALSTAQGTLQAGQSVTVTVSVIRHNGSGGSGYVVVDWNPVSPASAAEPAASPVTSQAVQVSWSATVTASPSPSPSASGSGGTPPSESDSSSPQFGSS